MIIDDDDDQDDYDDDDDNDGWKGPLIIITEQQKTVLFFHLTTCLPCSHVLPSGKSLTPVGHAQERPAVFNRHKWLQPPLVVESQGFWPAEDKWLYFSLTQFYGGPEGSHMQNKNVAEN